MAVFWVIWLKRNCRPFEGINTQDMAIVNIVISNITQRAANCKEFQGYDAKTIMRSWEMIWKEEL